MDPLYWYITQYIPHSIMVIMVQGYLIQQRLVLQKLQLFKPVTKSHCQNEIDFEIFGQPQPQLAGSVQLNSSSSWGLGSL